MSVLHRVANCCRPSILVSGLLPVPWPLLPGIRLVVSCLRSLCRWRLSAPEGLGVLCLVKAFSCFGPIYLLTSTPVKAVPRVDEGIPVTSLGVSFTFGYPEGGPQLGSSGVVFVVLHLFSRIV